MNFIVLIIFMINVISAMIIAEYRKKRAVFKDDIDDYHEAGIFFEGVFWGAMIGAAIIQFVS